MIQIPDAPYIREAETYGTDSMYDFVFGNDEEEEDDD